ncbi:MAG: family 43 glycosylhydrolase [Bacteroidaceae bacterium]|nr:family 43 glycosylhydrolase [Bacteroidaceae bacterium]
MKATKKWFAPILALLLVSGIHMQAQGQLTFKNPIIDEDAPDPTVMKAKDGYYYLYSTGDKIFRSPDMVNWKHVGRFFEQGKEPTFVPGVKRCWAPDINYIDKKYVLYFARSIWGGEDSCGVGVAYSDRPQGPFTLARGDGKLFRSFEIGVRNSIDPFYIRDKGRNWLIWGSFSGIYAIELTKDGLQVKPGAQKVQIGGKAYEGAYVYKRKRYYYFFGSKGSCCAGAKSTYTTVVARSKNLLGPYVDKQGRSLLDNHHEVLLHRNAKWIGTGHNGELIKDKQGRTWMPYHAFRADDPQKGRVVNLDLVQWNKDGWPYIENAEPRDEYRKPQF